MGGGDTDWTRVNEGYAEMRARAEADRDLAERVAHRMERMRGKMSMSLSTRERDMVIRALRAYKPTGTIW